MKIARQSSSKFFIKKRFGQHYLRDETIALKIVEHLTLSGYRNVLEVGPGTGILTRYLVQIPGIELRCIEIDERNVSYLKKEFPQIADNILHGDILKFDWKNYFDRPFAVIGNFPYNISSQIFFKILENRDEACEVVCMLQDEVARRLTASHGNKIYGILSVLLQAFFHTEYIFPVGKEVFYPQPKVKSAVVRFTRNSTRQLSCDELLFFKIVKAAFNQRRKMLRNSLQILLPESKIASCKTPASFFTKRAEELSVADFIRLTLLIQKTVTDI